MKYLMKSADSMEAEDWKAVYMILNHGISDAIDQIGSITNRELANRLVKALLDAEEYYINISNAVLGDGTGEKGCIRNIWKTPVNKSRNIVKAGIS